MSAGPPAGRDGRATRAVAVVLPAQLRALAGIESAVVVEVSPPVTQRGVLDALEGAWPVLSGTLRDPVTRRRRPYIRYFAGGLDLSHADADAAVPEAVAAGREPFVVIGAMAGG